MGELREIVDIATVNRLFLLLAIVGPLAGLIVGAVAGRRQKRRKYGWIVGVTVGLLGPMNWLLWQMFNVVTERNGLDTVKNLFINLALFVGMGIVTGLVAGRFFRPQAEPNQASEPDTEPTA